MIDYYYYYSDFYVYYRWRCIMHFDERNFYAFSLFYFFLFRLDNNDLILFFSSILTTYVSILSRQNEIRCTWFWKLFNFFYLWLSVADFRGYWSLIGGAIFSHRFIRSFWTFLHCHLHNSFFLNWFVSFPIFIFLSLVHFNSKPICQCYALFAMWLSFFFFFFILCARIFVLCVR